MNLIQQLRWYIENYYRLAFDSWSLYGHVTKLNFSEERITVSFSNTTGTKEIQFCKGTLEEVIGYLQTRFGIEKWRQLTIHHGNELLVLMEKDDDNSIL